MKGSGLLTVREDSVTSGAPRGGPRHPFWIENNLGEAGQNELSRTRQRRRHTVWHRPCPPLAPHPTCTFTTIDTQSRP